MGKPVVYIIYSSKWDQYYTGFSENLDKRIEYHNAGKNKSTRGGDPWMLVYYEEFPDTSSARKREYQIKSMKSRKYIEWLINSAEN